MKEVRGHIYEEYGFKADKRGFFDKWRNLTSLLSKSEDLPIHLASELAYYQLKRQENG